MKLGISREFNLLWTGETVSAIGTQFSTLAIPTVAILQLHAGPIEVGVLTGCAFAGYPVAGILAGPFVDRSDKRAVMLGTNAVRGFVLAIIAFGAAAGALGLWHLAIAALAVSAATALFDSAYQALLPAVVPPERLLAANSRLETSQNTAYFIGPAAAGFVIEAVSAVFALVADACSYAFAFATVWAIRPARALSDGARRGSFFRDLAAGFGAFRTYSFLIPIVNCVGISNAGNMMVRSLLLLLAYRAFGLPPSAIGWILAASGLAGIAGATAAGRIGQRFGIGSALAIATFVEGSAWCIVPLGLFASPIVVLAAAAVISGFMTPVWNVNNVTLRQRAVPLALQARVVALARAVG